MAEKNNYNSALDLKKKMSEGMERCAELIGPVDESKKGKYGFVPGMELNVQSEAILRQLESMKEGVFSVMFTGIFSSGKSTLINAMLGKKLLQASVKPETAVLTKLIFQKKDERVVVVKKDLDNDKKPVKAIMSLNDFFKEYRVSQEDPEKFIKTVDHAIIELRDKGIADGMVQFMDSPGTLASAADTAVAHKFLAGANAVVYLMNAKNAFQEPDKIYIKENYSGKHLQNIFFAINQCDLLTDPEYDDLEEETRKQLKEVYTDSNGKFDKDLYNRRVFFISGYEAFMARIGEKIITRRGEIIPDLKKSNIEAFEGALEEFLTGGGRDKAAFEGYMPQLNKTYKAVCDEYLCQKRRYEQSEKEIQESIDSFENNKKKLEDIYRGISESSKSCVRNIRDDFSKIYDNSVNHIYSGWEEYFSNKPVKLGMGNYMGLLFDNILKKFRDEEVSEEKMKKHTEPLQKAISEYLKPQQESMSEDIKNAVSVRVNELAGQFETYTKLIGDLNMPITTEDIIQTLIESLPDDAEVKGGSLNGSMAQIIMGIIAMDPEVVMNGMSGQKKTSSALFDVLLNSVIETVALYLVWWPIGLGMLAVRLFKMIRGGKLAKGATEKQLLIGMRDGTVEAMRDNKEKSMNELEMGLAAIQRAGDTLTSQLREMIDSCENKLKAALDERRNDEKAAEKEISRMDNIKKSLFKTINELNKELFGKNVSEADLEKGGC
ncbi:MAG: dynamin family protein [Ruminiclostridium sp.]|nr:dynamin family protein [Ruminiclostridium sp.]